jgi:integrase
MMLVAGIVERRAEFVFGAATVSTRAGFRAFRRAHASLLLEARATSAVTQAELRHADPKITLGIYGHVVGDAQRDAAEKAARKLEPKTPRIVRTNADQGPKPGEWIQ